MNSFCYAFKAFTLSYILLVFKRLSTRDLMWRFDENLTKYCHAIFKINTSADKKKLEPLKNITAGQQRQSMWKCKG